MLEYSPNYLVYVNTLLYVFIFLIHELHPINFCGYTAFTVWVVAIVLLGFFLLWLLLSCSLLERAPLLIFVSWFLLKIDLLCLIIKFFCIAVMLVGALIFVLGIDLVKEALWDTRHRVSRYLSHELSRSFLLYLYFSIQ